MKVKRKVGRQETKLEGKDKESKSIKVRWSTSETVNGSLRAMGNGHKQ